MNLRPAKVERGIPHIMDQRTTFRRLTVILSLLFTCAGLAILVPGRAQEGIPSDPFTIVVPAGDSMGLALALIRAGSVGGTVVLQNSTYRFNYPGSAETPQFPHLRGTVILEGNGATLEFSGTTADADLSTIFILENSRAEFRHLNLVVTLGKGRLVSNRGMLVINDSTLFNAQAGEGGGIENFGNLTLNRTILSRHRILSASTPGGAIWNSGTLTASCAQFRENRASQGGAVWNEQQGQVTISHSAFTGNQANGGGAIFNAGSLALNASENYWGGQAPLVNEFTAGVDTISEQVIVSGVLERDPTLDDPLCKPTLSTVEAGIRPLSIFEANSFVPLPLSAPVRVLAANSGALLTLYPDREPLSEVGDDPALLDTPLPSPDGHSILYTSYKSGNSEVYLRELSTGAESNLSNSPATWEGNYVWSPDGNWIAFNRQAGDYSQSSLGIVKTDGSLSWVQGTVPDPQYAPYPPSFPVWAADSQSLYFTQLYRIYRVGAAGGTPQPILQMPPLVENPLGTSYFNQIFALRGQTLLYKSYCYSITSQCLGVINLDGGGMRLVSILTASNESPQPSYSLDNSQVVVRDGSNLYVVKVSDFGAGIRSLIATGIAGRGVWQPAQVQMTPTLIAVCSNIALTGPKNIRSAPDAISPIVRTIPEGGQLAVDFVGYYRVSETEKWYRVRFEGSQYGWLSGDLFYTDPCPGVPELDALGNPLMSTPTPTPTPTPTLPPSVCQLRVLANLGTPTPSILLTPTLTSVPASGGRYVYDTALHAQAMTAEGALFEIPPGTILHVYARDPDIEAIVFVRVISHAHVYEGWINSEYGLEIVNHTDCGSIPSATLTPTPTPTPPTTGLGDYGIELREDGRIWSTSEKQALLVGVERVADAFTRFGVLGSDPPLRFKTVMGDWMVWLRLAEIRPANSPYALYYDTAAGECKVHDPIPSVINTLVVACRGVMRQTNTWITGGEVLETATVHELGHILDIRSGNQLRTVVGAPFMLPDCSIRGDRILGTSSGTGWLRGQRGWGSATPLGDDQQSISQFQQNPDNSGIEAAADMFLNWVYRRTSDAAPSNLPSDFAPNAPSLAVQVAQLADACTYPSTGAWEGFQNINRTGNPDPTLPGNRRYWWMEGTLSVIFKGKGWQ